MARRNDLVIKLELGAFGHDRDDGKYSAREISDIRAVALRRGYAAADFDTAWKKLHPADRKV